MVVQVRFGRERIAAKKAQKNTKGSPTERATVWSLPSLIFSRFLFFAIFAPFRGYSFFSVRSRYGSALIPAFRYRGCRGVPLLFLCRHSNATPFVRKRSDTSSSRPRNLP